MFALALAAAGAELQWVGQWLDLVPLPSIALREPSDYNVTLITSGGGDNNTAVEARSNFNNHSNYTTTIYDDDDIANENNSSGLGHTIVRFLSLCFGGGVRGTVVAGIFLDTFGCVLVEMVARFVFESQASVTRAYLPPSSSERREGEEEKAETRKEKWESKKNR